MKLIHLLSPIVFGGLFAFLILSCSDSSGTKAAKKQNLFKCSLSRTQIFAGDKLRVSVSQQSGNKFESARIQVQNKFDTVISSHIIELNTAGLPLGEQKVVITVKSGEKTEKHELPVLILNKEKAELKTYKVINSYPHDDAAYTQGLFYTDSILYESTGMKGRSSLRKVDLETGKPVQLIPIEDYYFGEGICLLKDKIYMLTWQSKKGFVYSKDSFERISEFTYPTEGWGITTDGEKLFMSDGSNNIYIMDPDSFSETGCIQVYDENGPISSLNELEYVKGYIYANVYQTDLVVKIDPNTGRVVERINLSGLLGEYATSFANVLNGIAYDAETGRMFVTGKNWPRLFEVEFIEPANTADNTAELTDSSSSGL